MNTKLVSISLAVAAAVLITILAAIKMGTALPWEVIQPDSYSYIQLASNLSDHFLFSVDGLEPSAQREILYPLFIACFMKLGIVTPNVLSISNVFPILIVQAALYLVALYLIAWIAARQNLPKAPPAIIVLGVIYLPITQYAFQTLSELLTVVLTVAFFSSIQWWKDRGGIWRILLGASLLGLLTITKSVIIPFTLITATILFLCRAVSMRLACTFLIMSLFLPSAWIIRNYVQLDTLILGTTDGVSSLYRGNMLLGEQPPSMQDSRIPEHIITALTTLTTQEQNTFLLQQVKRRLAENPLEYTQHLFFKAFVLLFGLPITLPHMCIMLTRIFSITVVTSRMKYYLRAQRPIPILILAFAGYLFGIYTLIYTTPRYFIPALFMLFPFIYEGTAYWLHKISQRGISQYE